MMRRSDISEQNEYDMHTTTHENIQNEIKS